MWEVRCAAAFCFGPRTSSIDASGVRFGRSVYLRQCGFVFLRCGVGRAAVMVVVVAVGCGGGGESSGGREG